MRRLLPAFLLALMLVIGLIGGFAYAQVVQPKIGVCYYGADLNPSKPVRFLPNPADPCPSGWSKEDWVND